MSFFFLLTSKQRWCKLSFFLYGTSSHLGSGALLGSVQRQSRGLTKILGSLCSFPIGDLDFDQPIRLGQPLLDLAEIFPILSEPPVGHVLVPCYFLV